MGAKDLKNDNVQEENKSFFDKMKFDKKYNAKVQLIGYSVLIVALVIYLNIASLTGGAPSNNLIDNDLDYNLSGDVSSDEDDNLLSSLGNNYRYDMEFNIKKNSDDSEELEEVKLRYVGKSYDEQMEFTKNDTLYYKVGNLYYTKNNDDMSLVDEDVIYDVIDSNYVELNGILDFINKSKLDRVTDYSSGKNEYVYHLKVKDVVVSYKLEDFVEISAVEDGEVLTIVIDYTKLLKVVDDSIVECKLEAKITDIGKVEKFVVLGDENTSED